MSFIVSQLLDDLKPCIDLVVEGVVVVFVIRYWMLWDQIDKCWKQSWNKGFHWSNVYICRGKICWHLNILCLFTYQSSVLVQVSYLRSQVDAGEQGRWMLVFLLKRGWHPPSSTFKSPSSYNIKVTNHAEWPISEKSILYYWIFNHWRVNIYFCCW